MGCVCVCVILQIFPFQSKSKKNNAFSLYLFAFAYMVSFNHIYRVFVHCVARVISFYLVWSINERIHVVCCAIRNKDREKKFCIARLYRMMKTYKTTITTPILPLSCVHTHAHNVRKRVESENKLNINTIYEQSIFTH